MYNCTDRPFSLLYIYKPDIHISESLMKWSGLLSLSLNLLQMYIVYDPTAILELSIVFLVQKLPNKQRLPLQ